MTETNKIDTIENSSENISEDIIKTMALWHYQRELGIKSLIGETLGSKFKNRYTFIDKVYQPKFKEIVSMFGNDYQRETALDVVYAYCTGEDEDIKKIFTGYVLSPSGQEIIGQKHTYADIVELVDSGLFPVWNYGKYDIYNLETREVKYSISISDLNEIYINRLMRYER